MHCLVYGAGAVGLYTAAALARGGVPVTLKARSASADPLTLVRGERHEEVGDVRIVDDLAGHGPFDWAIVATKAWQVTDAAREIVPVLRPGPGRILTVQNGVDAPEHVRGVAGTAATLAGTVVVIARRLAPSAVELVGADASITLGYLDHRDVDEGAAVVLEGLAAAGISASWTARVDVALWKKLALVASYGGVGALSGATVGETRAVPEARALVERAVQEVLAVARAHEVPLTDDDLADVLAVYDGFAPETTASMQRDLAEGRPSELADQNGAVVAHGRLLGVDTPVHETIFASQLPRERSARGTA
ncbi:ketopantoate reductase family protein [Georgenia alba]|uniref:2-dehydropantoate 2-reductase n=1 Tax=Georgenia alba TaxID=2233858 RepID=A0ABW2Q9S9_9MICO